MSTPTAALRAGFDYLRRNPLSLFTAARQAARMRLTIPLDLVRWGLGKIRSSAVGDFTVAASPPGMEVGLVASVMGNRLRVGGVVTIDDLAFSPDTLVLSVRLNGLKVEPLGGGGPIQALLASGAIDLAKPGNLVGFLPTRPPMLVEAKDDRLGFDLLKVPALAKNTQLRRVLGLLAPVLSIRDVSTQGDDLLVGVRVTPSGIPLLLSALRG